MLSWNPKDLTVRRVIKPILFLLCLVPLAWLVTRGLLHMLGANPIEKVIRVTGDWTLRMLLVTLCVTPLRRLTGWAWLLKLRRMLGLFAFFYACCHLISYIVLDQFFAWDEIWKDIVKRPFITVGMTAFVLLLPLAITSNQFSMKRLGGKRWQALHQLVYVIGCLGILHYFWLVKADLLAPIVHGTILLSLLSYRAWYARREQARKSMQPAAVNFPL